MFISRAGVSLPFGTYDFNRGIGRARHGAKKSPVVGITRNRPELACLGSDRWGAGAVCMVRVLRVLDGFVAF